MIYYIIYLSSATHLYTDSDLSDILSKSRINNTALDVSGLLLYHEGSILQILEGDEDVVMKLYAKIEKDSRHNRVIKMVTGTSEERNFPDWSMGFKAVTSEDWDDLSGYIKLNSNNLLGQLVKSNRKIHTMVNSYMSVNLR